MSLVLPSQISGADSTFASFVSRTDPLWLALPGVLNGHFSGTGWHFHLFQTTFVRCSEPFGKGNSARGAEQEQYIFLLRGLRRLMRRPGL